MLDRIMGVFRLDAATFEEIEHDQDATMQAALLVLVISVILGVGSGIGSAIVDEGFFGGFLSSIISAFVGWIVWSAITYFVGTSLFGGQADLGEMLRVIGFAYAPQILGIVPCIGWLIGAIWTLAAGFVAVRQGLDLDNTNALLTIIIGFIGYAALAIVVAIVFGVSAGLFGLLSS